MVLANVYRKLTEPTLLVTAATIAYLLYTTRGHLLRQYLPVVARHCVTTDIHSKFKT